MFSYVKYIPTTFGTIYKINSVCLKFLNCWRRLLICVYWAATRPIVWFILHLYWADISSFLWERESLWSVMISNVDNVNTLKSLVSISCDFLLAKTIALFKPISFIRLKSTNFKLVGTQVDALKFDIGFRNEGFTDFVIKKQPTIWLGFHKRKPPL